MLNTVADRREIVNAVCKPHIFRRDYYMQRKFHGSVIQNYLCINIYI
jgi:hypothetical protein